MHETITFLLVTFPNIHQFNFFFTRTLCNKPFLIWLLTTPPHLKYVATLPCNLSLMACFADINVSRGSVATYAGAVGFLISIERQIYQWKKLVNRLRFERFDRIMTVAPFFGPPSMCYFIVPLFFCATLYNKLLQWPVLSFNCLNDYKVIVQCYNSDCHTLSKKPHVGLGGTLI